MSRPTSLGGFAKFDVHDHDPSAGRYLSGRAWPLQIDKLIPTNRLLTRDNLQGRRTTKGNLIGKGKPNVGSNQVQTFCRICDALCPLIAVMDDDGEVERLLPDRDHPISKGHSCHKGLRYAEVHHDSRRVNFPQHRVAPLRTEKPEFERVSWDAALDDIAGRIKDIEARHGPDSVALYVGNPFGVDTTAYGSLATFMAKTGISMRFSAATQDCSNKFAAGQAIFGDSMIWPFPDFDQTDYLLCLGANPKVSKMVLVTVANPNNALDGILRRGGAIRYVNPRRIEAVIDHPQVHHSAIKPDTDLYFLAALLFEIDRSFGFDVSAIRNHGRNVEGLRTFISQYPPERVADVTGLSPDEIRQIAHEFVRAPRASIYSATGANMGRQGTLVSWLLSMLSFVTGNTGRPGGMIYRPMLDMAAVEPDSPPAYEDLFLPSPFGPMRRIFGDLPGNLLADYITLPKSPVKALIVLAGNPILSIGGGERLQAALEKLDLLVCHDLYLNTTGRMADYLLPGTDWLERRAINNQAMHTKPHLIFSDAVVSTKFERRSAWWIFAQLEKRWGLPSLCDQPGVEPFTEHEKILKRFGTSLDELKSLPHQTKVLDDPYPPESFYQVAVKHRDGRIDCCPDLFTDLIDQAETIFHQLAAEPRTQLKLISLRTVHMHNSNQFPFFHAGAGAVNKLHMNPADAAEKGLQDGDEVTVCNKHGRLHTLVRLDPSLREGVVAMTHGYGRHETGRGENCNVLLPSGPGSYDRFSNQAYMSGINVDVLRYMMEQNI